MSFRLLRARGQVSTSSRVEVDCLLHGPAGGTPHLDRVAKHLGASSFGLLFYHRRLSCRLLFSLPTFVRGREHNFSPSLLPPRLSIRIRIGAIILGKGDTGKGGRSREFGGEMHGRKLTKDAINVFSEAANPRRTKSWLKTRLLSSVAARDRSLPTSDRHSIISTSLRDSIWYISRDYTGKSQKDGALADWALAFGTG